MLWEIRGTRDGKAIRAKVAASSEESARRKVAANGVELLAIRLLDDPAVEAATPPTTAEPTNSERMNSVPANSGPAYPAPLSAEPVGVSPEAAMPSNDTGAAAGYYPPPVDDVAPPFAGAVPVAAPYPYPYSYPAPAPGYPMQYASAMDPGEKYSGLSIASLVCGCAAAAMLLCLWFLSPFVGVTGLVLGIIAWVSAKRTNNVKDKKMAMAGTFTSMGVLVLSCLFAAFMVMMFRAASKGAAIFPPPPAPVATAQPAPPTPGQMAAKLQQIENTWQPADANATDLLATMKGRRKSTAADGEVRIAAGTQIKTVNSFHPPTSFRIVLSTDEKDTRIRYGPTEIIFNWEMDRDELRIDGGPPNGNHKPGAGRLPYAQWVGIELVFRRNEMVIYIDGNERCRAQANFIGIEGPLSIDAHGGDLHVKSATAISQ